MFVSRPSNTLDMFAPPLAHRHIMELQPSAEDMLGVHNVPHAQMAPSKRTLSPSVTGTSVLAIKYDKGILLTADTLGNDVLISNWHTWRESMRVNIFSVFVCDCASRRFMRAAMNCKILFRVENRNTKLCGSIV